MSKVFLSLAIITSLTFLTACSGKKDDSNEPKGISYKASEITVRQCSDIGNQEFNTLLEKHEVSIKKQISPHLYIITWDDDDRTADDVVAELKRTTMFCGVDKYLEQPTQ
ncbi:MAG TPA: hypothetical protein EYP39_03210 [Ghiorsea sp.]|nr:hypothetical protein [Ghiorsea sp.]